MTLYPVTSSTGLQHTLRTTPDMLTGDAEATFTLTVTNPTADPVLCEGITLTIPDDLTSTPLTIAASSVACTGAGWHVDLDRPGAFTLTPPLSTTNLAPGEELVLTLGPVRLADGHGTATLTLREESGPSHSIPVSRMPNGYTLEAFAPTAAAVARDGKATLKWRCGPNAGIRYSLYYLPDGKESVAVLDADIFKAPNPSHEAPGVQQFTYTTDPLTYNICGFILRAITNDETGRTSRGTNVTVTDGDISLGNLEMTGKPGPGQVNMLKSVPYKVDFTSETPTLFYFAPVDGFLKVSLSTARAEDNHTVTFNATVTPPPSDAGGASARQYVLRTRKGTGNELPDRKHLLIPIEKGAQITMNTNPGSAQALKQISLTWSPMSRTGGQLVTSPRA